MNCAIGHQVSKRDACRLLGGLSMATLHKHIAPGRLPKVGVGGRVFIKRDDLLALAHPVEKPVKSGRRR